MLTLPLRIHHSAATEIAPLLARLSHGGDRNPMRSAHSALFGGLALVIAIGCGGANPRSGFEEEADKNGTDPNGSSGGTIGGSNTFGGNVNGNLTLDPKNTTVIIDSATTPVTPGKQTFK